MLGTTKHISEQTVKLFHLQKTPGRNRPDYCSLFLRGYEETQRLSVSLRAVSGQLLPCILVESSLPVNSSFLYTRILKRSQSFSYIRGFKLSHKHDLLEHPRKAFSNVKWNNHTVVTNNGFQASPDVTTECLRISPSKGFSAFVFALVS